MLEIWNYHEHDGTFYAITVVEGVITAIFVFDVAMQVQIFRSGQNLTTDPDKLRKCGSLCWDVAGESTHITVIQLGIIFAVVAWALKTAGYPSTMSFGRAVALITHDKGMIVGVEKLFGSITRSTSVFKLFTFIIFFFAIESMFLWRRIMPDLCSNFQDSVVFSFVFLATGENYADAADEIFEVEGGQAFFPWIAFWSLTGTLGLMSLVVATFEATHEQEEELKNKHYKKLRHTMLAPTFILWDAYCEANPEFNDPDFTGNEDTDEKNLTKKQFEELINACNKLGILRIDLDLLNRDPSRGATDCDAQALQPTKSLQSTNVVEQVCSAVHAHLWWCCGYC